MSNLSIKHEIKHFFDAPGGPKRSLERSQVKKGTCAQREFCLMNGVIREPGVGLTNASGAAYGALRAVVLAVYQVSRAIACKKGACQKVGDYLWIATQLTIAIPIILASTLIKIVRCLLGAIIHPIIAARKDSAIDKGGEKKKGKGHNETSPVISESHTGRNNDLPGLPNFRQSHNFPGKAHFTFSGRSTENYDSVKPPVVISGSSTGGGSASTKPPVIISGSSTGGQNISKSPPTYTSTASVTSYSSTADQFGNELSDTYSDKDGRLHQKHPKVTVILSEQQEPIVVEKINPIATHEGAVL